MPVMQRCLLLSRVDLLTLHPVWLCLPSHFPGRVWRLPGCWLAGWLADSHQDNLLLSSQFIDSSRPGYDQDLVGSKEISRSDQFAGNIKYKVYFPDAGGLIRARAVCLLSCCQVQVYFVIIILFCQSKYQLKTAIKCVLNLTIFEKNDVMVKALVDKFYANHQRTSYQYRTESDKSDG